MQRTTRRLFTDHYSHCQVQVPQHDRRLNHREAGRHLPQHFGGSRLDYGDFAFRMEGYAAVLSRDGQGGALLREVAKLEKFEDNMIETLGEELLRCPTFECSYGSCSNHVHPRRGSNDGKKNSQCEPWRWTSSLVRSHAMVQSPDQWWSKRRRWRELISPKRTKNVNELQVAVMQWELTLVEHESKFSEVVADSVKTAAMRAMLPKDVLERFLDRPFQYEELRNRVSAHVGEEAGWTRCEWWGSTHGHWADRQVRRRGRRFQCSSTAPSCMIDPIRNTSKCPTTSENPLNRRTTNLSPSAHHANRLHEIRNPRVM